HAGTYAAVVAYYSVQHVPRSDLGHVCAEVGRVLHAGGVLALATHLGDGEVYTEEFLGHRIARVGGALYQQEELVANLVAQGFTIESARQRGPLPHEHQSQRV